MWAGDVGELPRVSEKRWCRVEAARGVFLPPPPCHRCTLARPSDGPTCIISGENLSVGDCLRSKFTMGEVDLSQIERKFFGCSEMQ